MHESVTVSPMFTVLPDFGSGKFEIRPFFFGNPATFDSGQISSRILADASAAGVCTVYYGQKLKRSWHIKWYIRNFYARQHICCCAYMPSPVRLSVCPSVTRVVQQLYKCCRSCLKFYCMFYFTCDRSLIAPLRLEISSPNVAIRQILDYQKRNFGMKYKFRQNSRWPPGQGFHSLGAYWSPRPFSESSIFCRWLCLSVRLSVCHDAPSNRFLFFVSLWNRAISTSRHFVISPCGTLRNEVLRFLI